LLLSVAKITIKLEKGKIVSEPY